MGETQEKIGVPIEWRVPDSIVTRYANQMVAQFQEGEFIISFFEVRAPVLLGTPEERRAQLMKLNSVPAECVARIVVAAERMPEFVNALKMNLDRYSAVKAEGGDTSGEPA